MFGIQHVNTGRFGVPVIMHAKCRKWRGLLLRQVASRRRGAVDHTGNSGLAEQPHVGVQRCAERRNLFAKKCFAVFLYGLHQGRIAGHPLALAAGKAPPSHKKQPRAIPNTGNGTMAGSGLSCM